MTRAGRHPYFAQVHIAFWPVLWWNLVALQIDSDRLRAQYGPDILIEVNIAWWGGVRIARVYRPDEPAADWQILLIAASSRLDALFADIHALRVEALNWIVLPKRRSAISRPSADPALCDSS